MNIPNVLGTDFFMEQLDGWALLYIDCLIYKYKCLEAGQLPQKHLYFLWNLIKFIITKYLKQEVDDDLIICVEKRGTSL